MYMYLIYACNVYFFLPTVCFFTWKFNNSILMPFLTHNLNRLFIKHFVQFIIMKSYKTFFHKKKLQMYYAYA